MRRRLAGLRGGRCWFLRTGAEQGRHGHEEGRDGYNNGCPSHSVLEAPLRACLFAVLVILLPLSGPFRGLLVREAFQPGHLLGVFTGALFLLCSKAREVVILHVLILPSATLPRSGGGDGPVTRHLRGCRHPLECWC